MKKQKYIHLFALVGQIVGIAVALKYLPPYLVHNPGVQIILAVIILQDVAHYFLHDK